MTMRHEAILQRWISRTVAVRPGEIRALVWSFAYFFCLLAGYYVLRPLRDEMGVAGGVRNLQWLFTATFVAMLAVVPVYGAVVARLPRRRFVPIVYHFFVANSSYSAAATSLGKLQVARGVFCLDQRIQPVCRVGVLVVHGRPVPRPSAASGCSVSSPLAGLPGRCSAPR